MMKKETPKSKGHRWVFKARFRRDAYGWSSSRLAVQRIKEALAEIRKVRKADAALAGEGAVAFLERLSPALQHVDSSSGALGTAVNRAIEQLVPMIAGAPVDDEVRRAWLKRLFDALEADEMPYIESLGDFWGDLCVTREFASDQAEEDLEITRRMLAPGRRPGSFYFGTSACLSALFKAERFGELIEIAGGDHVYWSYRQWAVKALAAQGRTTEALEMAEASRRHRYKDLDIDRLGEEILLASGRIEDAYRRFGLSANRRGTYLATLRAVAKRYPSKDRETILRDLVASTPGEEGKWFAAAKSVGLLDQAIALARQSPCDPRTLYRAARDFADKAPAFAVEAGLLSLHWMGQGRCYELTGADVLQAYRGSLRAARNLGDPTGVEGRIWRLLQTPGPAVEFLVRVITQYTEVADTEEATVH